jgi:hypothetical protein
MCRDGLLCYFDTENGAELGLNSARGKIDLKAVSYEVSFDQNEGGPTPHCMQIIFSNDDTVAKRLHAKSFSRFISTL